MLSIQPKARGTALPALAFWPQSQPLLITCPFWALNLAPCEADLDFCPSTSPVRGPPLYCLSWDFPIGLISALTLFSSDWLLSSLIVTLQNSALLCNYHNLLLICTAHLNLETTPAGHIILCHGHLLLLAQHPFSPFLNSIAFCLLGNHSSSPFSALVGLIPLFSFQGLANQSIFIS